MTAVLACDAVTRWYGQVIGVNAVTCEIQPGVTGILGPNGAGKSTLFNIISGQLRPSKGRVLLLGHDQFPSLIILSILVAVFVPLTHRKNIQRLLKGEESKFTLKKKKKEDAG